MPSDTFEADKLLLARTSDALRICEKNGTAKFVGFLDETSAAKAKAFAEKEKADFTLFGGYKQAERVLFGAVPEWISPPENAFPIQALTLEFKKGLTLSHRDFLGSLMALGLNREAVGDILSEEGRAVLFLTTEACKLVKNELSQVGRVGVKIFDGFNEPLPCAHTLIDCSCFVPSLRLDALVSGIMNNSRSDAVCLIESGMVFVNSLECEKCTKQINHDDVLKIRGAGKFIICDTGDLTRKGRIVLKYKKYN